MSGMTTTGTTGVSDYNTRTVEIEVTGLCRQDVMRTSNYTVRVPFSRMSQVMQGITSIGGKVKSVSMGSGSSAGPSSPAEASNPAEEG